MYKKTIFYINLTLFILVVLITINTFDLPGNGLIKAALAHSGISYEGVGGTVGFLSRFAAGANPSTTIGNSIIYDDGTNVGIGTTAPGDALEIYGDQKRLLLRTSTAGGNTGVKFQSATGNLYLSEIIHDSGNLYFKTTQNGTLAQRMFIDGASGNVGIGTTNPAGKLHVSGGISAFYPVPGISASEYYSAIFSNNANATIRFRHLNNVSWIHTDGNQELRFGANGLNDHLTIKATGNVGIGTTVPNMKVHIATPAGGGIMFDDTNNTNAWWIRPNGGTSQFAIGNTDDTSDGNMKFLINYLGAVGVYAASDRPLTLRRTDGATGSGFIQFETSNGVPRWAFGPNVTNASTQEFGLHDYSDNTVKFLINSNKFEMRVPIMLTPLSSDPSGPVNGMMWMRQ